MQKIICRIQFSFYLILTSLAFSSSLPSKLVSEWRQRSHEQEGKRRRSNKRCSFHFLPPSPFWLVGKGANEVFFFLSHCQPPKRSLNANANTDSQTQEEKEDGRIWNLF